MYHTPTITGALAMTTSSPPSQSSNITQERAPLLAQLIAHFEGVTCTFVVE